MKNQLLYKAARQITPTGVPSLFWFMLGTEVHHPRLEMLPANLTVRCASWIATANYQKGEAKVMDDTHVCSEETCQRIAHSGFVTKPRKMHCLLAFVGMTCFEIIHSQTEQ